MSRVAVDVDGVLYKWVPTAWYMLKRQFPELDVPGADKEALENWLDAGVAGITEGQWAWLWEEPQIHNVFRFGHVVKGAPDVLRELSVDYELLVVTARPEAALTETFDFLKAFPFAEVHILHGQPKTSVPFDLLIDDRIENIMQVLNEGRRAIIFDQPWNRNVSLEEGPGVERALSWDDVPTLLEEMLP